VIFEKKHISLVVKPPSHPGAGSFAPQVCPWITERVLSTARNCWVQEAMAFPHRIRSLKTFLRKHLAARPPDFYGTFSKESGHMLLLKRVML